MQKYSWSTIASQRTGACIQAELGTHRKLGRGSNDSSQRFTTSARRKKLFDIVSSPQAASLYLQDLWNKNAYKYQYVWFFMWEILHAIGEVLSGYRQSSETVVFKLSEMQIRNIMFLDIQSFLLLIGEFCLVCWLTSEVSFLRWMKYSSWNCYRIIVGFCMSFFIFNKCKLHFNGVVPALPHETCNPLTVH